MNLSNSKTSIRDVSLVVENWPMSLDAVREQLKQAQIRLERYRAALRLAGTEIERRNQSIVSLTAFTNQASRVTSPGVLLKLALVQALQITVASSGAIVIFEPESKALVLGIHHGLTPPMADILTGRQLGYGAMALMPHLVAGSGALLEIKTTEDEAEQTLLQASNLTSLVSLPLQIGATLTGALLVGLRGERTFKSAELCFLMGLSQATANALEAFQLREKLWGIAETLLIGEATGTELESLDDADLNIAVQTPLALPVTPPSFPQPSEDDLEKLLAAMMDAEEEVQQQHGDLQQLNTIAEALNRTLNLKEILQCAVDQTQAILRSDAAWIYLVNEDQQLELVSQTGLSATYVRGMRLLNMGEGLDGRVAGEQIPRFVNQVTALDNRAQKIWVDKEQLQALAVVPITRPASLANEGRPASLIVGVLGVAKRVASSTSWSPREMRLLTSIANQVALAIDNAQLYAQIQEDHANLSAGNEILRELNELILKKNAILSGFIEDDLLAMLTLANQQLKGVALDQARLNESQKDSMRKLYKILNQTQQMALKILNTT
jgi:GAF domain-containing protein